MVQKNIFRHLSLSILVASGRCYNKGNTERTVSNDALLTRRASSAPTAINISVPIDHFHNDSLYEPHSEDDFPLRYWFDATYYSKGGPVIILASGETSGEDRLPYLDHGILQMLAKATGGIGVVLEHRYYGTSFPVPDLSAKNMRFLSTEQALADTDYFARNVKFPGLEDLNLTAPATPYIIYGGSYAGAFAAFARKVYPETFWGAIASSAVTEAIEDYWEYYEAARLYAPGDCAEITQKLTHVIDNVLLAGDDDAAKRLKNLFGLGKLANDDFANTITRGISGLQNTIWIPEEDDSGFGTYCASVSSNDILFASTRQYLPLVRDILSASGYETECEELENQMLNYVGYVRSYVRDDMAGSCKNKTVVECYTAHGQFDSIDLDQGMMRSWTYQTCTQWGYFQTGSGVPEDQLPLISRLIDLNYTTIGCREGFNITNPPNVEVINRLGGLNFSYPRVAFIDGEKDPWRAATPHRIGLPSRESTTSEPYILIENGVHHWDESGLSEDAQDVEVVPEAVEEAQKEILGFVKQWIEEWESKDDSSLLADM